MNEHYYVFDGEGTTPMQVHHYGSHMSYSTSKGDFLCRLFAIKPYTRTDVVREVIREEQQIVTTYDLEDAPRDMSPTDRPHKRLSATGTKKVVTTPVYESKRVDATPPFTPLGKPIKVGDSVTFKDVSGRLIEITDTYFTLDTASGRRYYPWTDTNVADKVTRQK